MSTAAFTLLITGCGPSKVAQCNDFIEVSNNLGSLGENLGNELQTELDQKLAGLNSPSPDFQKVATDLKSAADTIDTKAGQFLTDATTQLSAVELKDETLSGIQSQYVDMLNNMGEKVGNMSEALRNMGDIFSKVTPDQLGDQAALQQLQDDMEKAGDDINTAVKDIDELSAQEDQFVSEVNTYCGATPPTEDGSASPSPAPEGSQ